MVPTKTKLIQKLHRHTPFLFLADFHLHPFTLGGGGGGGSNRTEEHTIDCEQYYVKCCWNIWKYFTAERLFFFQTLQDCRLFLSTICCIRVFCEGLSHIFPCQEFEALFKYIGLIRCSFKIKGSCLAPKLWWRLCWTFRICDVPCSIRISTERAESPGMNETPQ